MHQLEGHACAAEMLRAGRGAQPRVDARQCGFRQAVSGFVMVGDDDLDPGRGRPGNLVDGRDAAVHRNQQAGRVFPQAPLQGGTRQAVALADPVRQKALGNAAQGPEGIREQRGSRPVLVVSPTEFNEATKLPVVLPITNGGEFARRLGFSVAVTGIKTTGVVRCDQPRVIDLAARHGRKVDVLPEAILDEVLAKVGTLFE